ncbi:MAG: tRNA preQ1(34) S-adenosylmethionine ribosyltransferase-isomerase QueA [Myxococcales bacterium]|nr:tRNA preQ1(34) S-adenosylmethionine ribosyltransferase-isomerase QueA [Myxococcales bacterium]
MRTQLLDYDLPPELIAVYPPKERDAARLLCLEGPRLEHRLLTDLPELVPEGALLVLNDTRVFRARLVGQRPGGGHAELLLLRRRGPAGSAETWTALGRPAKRFKLESHLNFGELTARVAARLPEGELEVQLEAAGPIADAIERVGRVPIPPYLRREDEPADAERYQTLFARSTGSVAAPTAGLHLTQALFERLERRGVELAHVTLHVGPGTFKPVSSDDLDEHPMHSEAISVGEDLVEAVAGARLRGAPIVAVGTTVVRALESARDAAHPGHVRAFQGDTRLLIQPGYRFGVVDALLTNFHMPKSTLLALVAAFAGLEPTLAAYRAAVSQKYRFLSYGDAMWIPIRRPEPRPA